MTRVQVFSVRVVDDDTTECRRCHRPIARGRRVADVAGTGRICLRCLIDLTLTPPAAHDTGPAKEAERGEALQAQGQDPVA
jgi:hypothetical protein